jgi:hypothetical protein
VRPDTGSDEVDHDGAEERFHREPGVDALAEGDLGRVDADGDADAVVAGDDEGDDLADGHAAVGDLRAFGEAGRVLLELDVVGVEVLAAEAGQGDEDHGAQAVFPVHARLRCRRAKRWWPAASPQLPTSNKSISTLLQYTYSALWYRYPPH